MAEITIPESVYSIRYGVFENCTALKNLVLPDNINYMDGSIARDCTSLESITFPYSFTTIAGSCCNGCTNLTSVYIPAAVTTIENYAFEGCSRITDVYYEGTEADWKKINIQSNNDYLTYHTVNFHYNYSRYPETDPVMPTDRITLGESITLNLSPYGAGTSCVVMYKKKTDTEWVSKNPIGTTFTFTPSKAVDYDICIAATDTQGNTTEEDFSLMVDPVPLINESVVSTTTAKLGQPITVNCAASGGTGTYTYLVYYKKATDTTWTYAQNYSANTTAVITPMKATTYDIGVFVRDKSGVVTKKFFVVNVEYDRLQNTTTASDTTIHKGTSVTLNCSAEGGNGNYQYAVYYKRKTDANWTSKQNFSANATVSISPAKLTKYDIMIKVKDTTGTVSKKYLTVNVVK